MISYYWNRRLLDLIPIRYQFSFNQYYDTTQTKQQCQKRNESFPSFSIHHSTAHHKSVIKNWLQPHRALSIYLHSSAHYLTNRMDSGKKKFRAEWDLTTLIEANVWGNVECDFCHHRKLSWMCYAKKKMKWHDHDCLHLCVEQTQICTDVNKQKYTYVQINMNDLILRYHLHVVFFFLLLLYSSHFFSPDNFSVVHSTLSRTYNAFENNAEMWYTCDSCIRFERFFFWFGFLFIGFPYVYVGVCGRIYRHFTMVNAVL